MRKWSDHIVEMSLCGLGQTAPLPLVGGLRYFLEEFMEHINDKHCVAHQCTVLEEREQRGTKNSPAWLEESYLPARIGERYRRQFSAITAGNGNGNGTGTPAGQTESKTVRR
jgi:NADH-ubiquinone oxidoreductase-F iron-sulfur binding region